MHIAFQISGDGPVDLVWIPGAVSHLDLDWESAARVRYIADLSAFARLVRHDKRCTGLSDRPTDVATLEERVEDVRAVMDAAGSERAVIFGMSEGGSMACLFAATYPERTRALTLYGTKPRWVRAPDYPWGQSLAERERSIEEAEERGWPEADPNDPFVRRWLGEAADDPAYVAWFVRLQRAGSSPAARIAATRMNARIDIRDILPTIRVATLVMNRSDDPAIEIEAARDLAARIPGARFVELPGTGHLWHGIWPRVLEEIRRFALAEQPELVADRVLTSILFLDIVRSTEQLSRIGDAAWGSLLERFYGMARRELAVLGGVEVDAAGDGLFTRFDGPARAIRCARTIQRAARELGLEVRAGVHTGEVEVVDRHVRGIAVHTAVRIAALAGPGEVYVSTTVRDLVAGSGLAFEDRGVHELKGMPEPRRVLAVASA